MASGVWRSKHALPCAQHPAPRTILSTQGKYDIIEPLGTLSYIIADGLLLNFDASSGYLPTNF